MSLNFDNTENAFTYKSTNELKNAKLLFASMANPFITKWGIKLTNIAFSLHLPIKSLIKMTIYKQFCGGETLVEANETSQMLNKYGVQVILDYGVEGKSDEAEFEKTTASFIDTIRFAKNKENIPFISIKITGFARFELLEKIHLKTELNDSELQEFERVKHRVDLVCYEASISNKMILIDAEESWIQQPVDDIADEMMQKYNSSKYVVFNTYQLYRHDRLEFLKKSHLKALSAHYLLGAKLVRGAYMEKERLRAQEFGYDSPIQTNKENTDRDYNQAIDYCLSHSKQIAIFIGTHNEFSCLHAATEMLKLDIDKKSSIYFSQLYGMSDNITFNLAKDGYMVSKYLPYGPIGDVIPYLMRRAQENTSVAGQTGRELTLINKELKRRNT